MTQTPAKSPRPPGRPKAKEPKVPISLRLDAKVADHLRASGDGWQTRVNDKLAAAIKAGEL